jgi:hypothetical protein
MTIETTMPKWKTRPKRKRRKTSVERERISKLVAALLARAAANLMNGSDEDDSEEDNLSYKFHVIPRVRTSLLHIRQKLSDYHFRRAYRMSYDRLKELVDLLSPFLEQTRSTHFRRKVVNGPISDALRVSICLRFLAGGSVYDIALVYGVAVSTVYQIVGEVVDAIDKCPSLEIAFPTDHAEQARIAEGFKAVSAANFGCCIGVIDGILVWTEKPSEAECLAWSCTSSAALV